MSSITTSINPVMIRKDIFLISFFTFSCSLSTFVRSIIQQPKCMGLGTQRIEEIFQNAGTGVPEAGSRVPK